jgi:hypothetical protein
MKREYNELLSAWCDGEITVLKTKGRNQRLSTEATSANLVLRNVLSKNQDEVRVDNNLAKAMLAVLFESASLSDLRLLAAKNRKKQNKPRVSLLL